MSTMIALFLVLSALVGCAGETLSNVKNALPSTTPGVVLSVELETYEDTVQDEDGAVLAECSYELPVMKALLGDGSFLEEAGSPEQEKALAAVETFNARFEQWKDNGHTLAQTAREDRAFRNEAGLESVPYTDDLHCTVYQTEQLVSVRGNYYTYTGGAHPNSILMSWNFDVESGEFFEPEILDEGKDLREFVQGALVEQARRTAAENNMAVGEYFWEDYADTLGEWSSYAVSFDEEGMTVGFSPYELAAYAAGAQVFQLSYEELYPHLGEHGKTLLGLESQEEPAY